MASLQELKDEEERVAREWLDLLFLVDEMASMRADHPDSGGFENFRELQQRAHEAGRRRVELQTRIAMLDRQQRLRVSA